MIIGLEQMPLQMMRAFPNNHVVTLCQYHYGKLRYKTAIKGYTVRNGRLYHYVKEHTI